MFVRPYRNVYRVDEENEMSPATVASTRALGITTLRALCETQGCWHDTVIPLDGWAGDQVIASIAQELHCLKCAGRKVKTMVNMSELYPNPGR
jgi:hypothetical protein